MHPKNDDAAALRRRSWLSFALFALFLVGCWAGWRWLVNSPKEDGIQAPLRAGLEANEKLFAPQPLNKALVKTYSVSAADKNVRFNGSYGLRTPLDSQWRLQVVRAAGDTLRLTLNQLRILPRRSIVFDFKCIEGWSQKSHWGGVRVADFMKAYGLNDQMKMGYMGLETPDGQYYVGIDMASALHPQTLLAYEMNGKPLSIKEGYPLRLIIPVKYGIKHLKRIGSLHFSNERPRDYWAERGYDYYAGH